jgi:hypothetical protein
LDFLSADHTLLGHYSAELVGRPHEVDVEIGPRQFIQQGESVAEFAARVRRWIALARSGYATADVLDSSSWWEPAAHLPAAT